MVTVNEAAQLSLYVYNIQRDAEQDNRPLLPSTDWVRLEYQPDNSLGFSYGVFQNTATHEIVVSFTGSNEKLAVDFLGTNIPAGLGLSGLQINQAAAVANRIINAYGAQNHVTFTGHSLGGGLASVMAVWFNRGAVVFDPAPFESTALDTNAIQSAREFIENTSAEVSADLSLYIGASQFATRERAVTSYFAKGEVLEWLRGFVPAVVGTEVAVQFGTDWMAVDATVSALGGDRTLLHSQALLTAGLMSDSFRRATLTVQATLPVILDNTFYAVDAATSTQRNFLIDLIRSEQANIGNGKLSHFAADLHRLGQDLTGLNEAAQKAIVARGVEWYYWQGTNYAGQEFSVRNGSLLQYTTAMGASLPGAQNKAADYLSKWLTPIANTHGEFYFPSFGTKQQWSVVTGTAAASATAVDLDKTQMFVGNAGADVFTGGHRADVFFGGEGNDTVNGGAGNDQLYGGAGNDRYNFSGTFGEDLVIDSDGTGTVWINSVQMRGGKKIAGLSNSWISDDKAWRYELGSNGDLLIRHADGSAGSVMLRGWQNGGGNLLDIELKNETAAPPAPPTLRIFLGDQAAPLKTNGAGETTYDWGATTWNTSNGTLNGGIAQERFADVIRANLIGTDAERNIDARIYGYGGNDALGGADGNDEIDGGEGDDLIAGGDGRNELRGGAGNDFISATGYITAGQRVRPGEVWTAPSGATVLGSGPTWGVYESASGEQTWFGISTIPSDVTVGSVIDAGDGNDHALGSWAGDTIYMGANNDVAEGLAGRDVIYGEGGNDKLFGDGTETLGKLNSAPGEQHGDDLIDGGTGNDSISGQGGSDVLLGGGDNDELWGDGTVSAAHHGDDYLSGGAGLDNLRGDGGDDFLDGGTEQDHLYGDSGDDLLMGGAGDDELQGDNGAQTPEDGDDVLHGEAGNDLLVGNGGHDQLFGGADDDELQGDNGPASALDGNDWLDGGDGSDTLSGGGGRDTLIGGIGADVLDGDAGTPSAFDGADHLDGGQGNDTIVGGGNDDVLLGGDGNDSLSGDNGRATAFDGDDNLDGGAGNDTMYGSGGRDTLMGGIGDDVITGDAGNNSAGSFGEADLLDGGEGDDRLYGEEGDDTLFGGNGKDILNGNAGNDFLRSGAGDDRLFGEAGDDVLEGGDGNDHLLGEDGSDAIDGGSGTDTVEGGAGNDYLTGGFGRDTLLGGSGNDRLDGSSGDDLLNGGTGNDTYVFGRGYGNDQITDLDLTVGNLDRLILSGLNAASVQLRRTPYGLEVQILGADDSLLVRDHFGGGQVEEIEFGDGTVWDSAQISAQLMCPTVSSDLLVGSISDDVIDGGLGDDIVEGSDGNDTLQGGGGYDELKGGGGDDRIAGGTGNEYFYGEAGSDTYVYALGDGNDTFRAADTATGKTDTLELLDLNPSDITLLRNYHDLRLVINGTNNYLYFDGFFGYSGGPYLEGRSIDRIVFANGTIWDGNQINVNTMVATNGTDEIIGFNGNDALYGGAGDDSLIDDGGNDTLDGGLGNDMLQGGIGDDVYLFGIGSGADSVYEQDESIGGTDTIRLGSGLTSSDLTLMRNGGYGADDLIVQINATGEQLKVVDFFGYGSGPSQTIEYIEFSNGSVWDYASVSASAVLTASLSLDGTVANDTLTGGRGDDFIDGREGNDSLFGGVGDDRMWGENGNDTLTGGFGSDYLQGGSGSDTYMFSRGSGADEIFDGGLSGDVNVLRLTDINASEVTVWRQQDDLMVSVNGTSDIVKVSYHFDSSASHRLGSLVFGDGTSWNRTAIEQAVLVTTLGDDTLIGYGGSDILFGSAGADALAGREGNDTLDGGTGDDSLEGGSGSDTYVFGLGYGSDYIFDTDVWNGVQNTVRFINLNAADLSFGRGTDVSTDLYNLIVQVKGSRDRLEIRDVFWRGLDNPGLAPINRFEFADGSVWSMADVWAIGMVPTTANDFLLGDSGDNTLNGGAGSDTLHGGVGNDTYQFGRGSGQDVILANDSSANKIDTLQLLDLLAADVSVKRSDGGLLLRVHGTSDSLTVKNYFGGDKIEQIVFSDGTVWTESFINNMTLQSTNEADVIVGFVTDDTICGGFGEDHLVGGDGNDTLMGDADADTLLGGAGNDTYVVGTGDTTIEAADEGTDSVQSSITWILATHVENLTLTGTSAIDGTGNTLDNSLVGNDGANVLTGGAGHDTLNGGAGSDQLDGGAGDDTYMVDEAGDVVIETAGQGTDSVQSSISYILGTYVENLILGGNPALNSISIDGTGNDLANTITGNRGGNKLDGGMGVDTLIGGDGNDTYYLDSSADMVVETSATTWIGGYDTAYLAFTGSYDFSNRFVEAIYAQVGAVNVIGNSLDNHFQGGNGDDRFVAGAGNDYALGGDGADTLVAGSGYDYLHGGAGQDTYEVDLSIGGGAEISAFWNRDGDQLVLKGVSLGALKFERVVQGQSEGGVEPYLIAGAGDNLKISAYGVEGYVFIPGYFAPDGSAPSGVVQDIYLLDTSANRTRIDFTTVKTAVSPPSTVGADWLFGFDVSETISGGLGNDWIVGGGGSDQLNGNQGSDRIEGLGVLDGGEDNDYLEGSGTLIGGSGNDLLFLNTFTFGASPAPLLLLGGSGNDELTAHQWSRTAAAVLDGGSGDDLIQAGNGDTILHRRADGVDVVYSYGANVEIRLEGLTLSDIHLSRPSSGAGYAPNDLLIATKTGVDSDSILIKDYFRKSGAAQPQITVLPETGSTNVYGAVEATTIASMINSANALSNTLSGTASADRIDALAGSDQLSGLAGNDTLLGGDGNDILHGGEGDDSLDGGAGDDALQDYLGLGQDTFIGGAGNNSYTGLSGGDVAYGGANNDTYFASLIGGNIDIHESANASGAVDTLNLGDTNPYALIFRQTGNDLMISDLSNGASMTVHGWYVANNVASDRTIEQIHAEHYSADGLTFRFGNLTDASVQQLVEAMATFSAAPGQTELSAQTNKPLYDQVTQAWGVQTFEYSYW